MISCRRAAELISKELDTDLSFQQRVRLGFHTIVCSGCRRFRRQLKVIDVAVTEFFEISSDENSETSLSADSKQRLKAIVDSHLD